MAFFSKFGRSAMELRSIRCLTVTGVLIALDIVLKMVSIRITADIKITFAYLALATIGMLYGPTVAFAAGAITDIVGFMISPDGGFNILFTLVEAVGAMIYGIFLYELAPLSLQKQGDVGGRRAIDLSSPKRKPLSKPAAAVIALVSGLVLSGLCVLFTMFIGSFAGDEGFAGKMAKVMSGDFALAAAAVLGLFYGCFFAVLIMLPGMKGEKRMELRKTLRVILSKVTVIIVCNLIMTPAAMILSQYSTLDSMAAGYPLRLFKNAVQCPVDCALLIMILFPILGAYRQIFPAAAKKAVSAEQL